MKNKKSGMSLLSLLLTLTMIIVVMAATVPVISQNIQKISKGKKGVGEVSLTDYNGYFICYYNDEGGLNYKQVEFDRDDIRVIGSGENVTDGCKFIVPDANLYTITLVGGGGGGASTYIVNNPDYIINKDENDEIKGEIKIGDETKLTTDTLAKYSAYVDKRATKAIMDKLLDRINVYIGQNGMACGYQEKISHLMGLKDINPNKELKFKFETSDYLTTFNISEIGGETKTITEFDTSSCGTSVNAAECGTCTSNRNSDIGSYMNNNRYVIVLDDRGYILKKGDSIIFELLTYATQNKVGQAGKAGEVKKTQASFLGKANEEIIIKKEDIGIGGRGANALACIKDEKECSGGNGGNTSFTIKTVNNEHKITAYGGEGGKIKEEISTKEKIKIRERGIDGEKPVFYIPSQLGAKGNFSVGHGSTCGLSDNKDNCPNGGDSIFPGSSGASSGYYIGGNLEGWGTAKETRVALGVKQNDAISMLKDSNGAKKIIYTTSGNGAIFEEDKQKFLDAFKKSTEANPHINSGDGGRGANGAILISW